MIAQLIKLLSKAWYFNRKYPERKILVSRGKEKVKATEMFHTDLRFPSFLGTDDEKALQALKWVHATIQYTSDKELEGIPEYWAYSYETLDRKRGDCEDGGILLYDILRSNNVPAWKLRLSAGLVQLPLQKTGHCYLTYYCESTDRWVILDWCYWYNLTPVQERPDYKEMTKYGEIWFSFNEEKSWSKGLNAHAYKLLGGKT